MPVTGSSSFTSDRVPCSVLPLVTQIPTSGPRSARRIKLSETQTLSRTLPTCPSCSCWRCSDFREKLLFGHQCPSQGMATKKPRPPSSGERSRPLRWTIWKAYRGAGRCREPSRLVAGQGCDPTLLLSCWFETLSFIRSRVMEVLTL